jgi:sugar phosphate isomerase/epimerase
MPWTSVRSLAEARLLVEAVNHPNGRILVDAIHLDRAGEGEADLAGVEPSRLAYFHLCDAPRERPADMATMLHQARTARLPPGEGGLDLSGMLAALPADMPIGVEVPMRERAEPAAGRAAALLAATLALLARPGR